MQYVLNKSISPRGGEHLITPICEFVIKEKVSKKPGINPFQVYWPQGYFTFSTINKKKRLATVTDVKFIDDDTIVVAHRAAAALFLIKLVDNRFEVIDKIRLRLWWRGEGRFFHPDLIAVNGSRIYMTEYTARVLVVDIIDNKFRVVKHSCCGSIPFHGCFSDNQRLMLGAVEGLQVSVLNSELGLECSLHVESEEPDVRIKTVGVQDGIFFLGLDRHLGGVSTGWFNAYQLVGNQLVLIHSLIFEDTQIDGHVFNGQYHFVAMEPGGWDAGCIAVIAFDGTVLDVKERIKYESFPHGLDIRGDTLIYSSYANSSVVKCRLAL